MQFFVIGGENILIEGNYLNKVKPNDAADWITDK